MKRIHLFEFEDKPWFPQILRTYLMRMIIVMHKLLGTKENLSKILKKLVDKTGSGEIVDLCSGGGGPMPEVLKELRNNQNLDVSLTLTDLYPNHTAAKKFNNNTNDRINYRTEPIDATSVETELQGIRTMVSSFHHMKPEVARKILEDAFNNRRPICIYEISDNSIPLVISFLALPINLITGLIVPLFSKPLSPGHLFFTYIIPAVPLAWAWDGAISNMRTYTLSDLNELLDGLEADDYVWEKDVIKGKALYLIGFPK